MTNAPLSPNTNSRGKEPLAGAPVPGQETDPAKKDSFLIQPPAINLPKGGGAIRGIGEKFTANPVTGTGSIQVPIATSPGRSGFGPQLALSYDSGTGNGPFGFGWSLSLPAVTRKTDKGLPQYNDHDESDVFILSGSEDLVPVLQPDGTKFKDTSFPGYVIDRYQPRIEGLFARIERWANIETGEMHWRSITRDNITSIYGKTNASRIFDPADKNPVHPARIFSWLICQRYDDKGNAMLYEYAAENGDNTDQGQANERNRVYAANRYVKCIKYGNRITNRDGNGNAIDPTELPAGTWMFEVVFDYGEGHLTGYEPDSSGRIFTQAQIAVPAGIHWPVRQDPFSVYRAGFEIRTNRLCRRVLMFHHFPEELGIADCLVRSTELFYTESPAVSFIAKIMHAGFLRQPVESRPNRYEKKSFPPVEFRYSSLPAAEVIARLPIRDVDPKSLENLPVGLDSNYQWVDLDGEGISGILTEQSEGWFYKRNLSANNQVPAGSPGAYTAVRFGPAELVAKKPVQRLANGAQLLDLAGDGQIDLVQMEDPVPGFYERTTDCNWTPFHPFVSCPKIDFRDPGLRFIDVTGDGHADILITEGEALTWYPSMAEAGFGPAVRIRLPPYEEKGPCLVFANSTQSIFLADLSGDGLSDLVRIRNGEICYWPSLGYGHFGAKVTMDNAPYFDTPDQFDQRYIRLADIDGSGTTDMLYLGRDRVQLCFNQSGNRWSRPVNLPQFPLTDNLSSVQVLDLLGNGTACLVWSSPLPGNGGRQMRYIDLMDGQKPHLLIGVINNLGAETTISYASSTKFYLDDKLAGKPWITKLPFPVHCVEKVTVHDRWRKTAFSNSYAYHHGYFDGEEREFRGFGRVEQVDEESYGVFSQGNVNSPYITPDQTLYQPPVKTVTWYHTGALVENHLVTQFSKEYFPNWFEDTRADEQNVLGGFQENLLPEPDLGRMSLTPEEGREALRACKGMALRQEIYELDVDALQNGLHRPVKLFSTVMHNCRIQRLQAKAGNRHAVFLVTESEAITYHYELDLRTDNVSPDPRIEHTLNLATDRYGNILQAVAVVYPRVGQFEDAGLGNEDIARIRDVQQERHLAYTEYHYTHDDMDDDNNHRLPVLCETLTYELTGILPYEGNRRLKLGQADNRYFTLGELQTYRLSAEHQAIGEPVPEIAYHQLPSRRTPQKRCVEQVRILFFEEDLSGPLPFRHQSRLGLPYETYNLALTDALLQAVFSGKLTADAANLISNATISGYLTGAALADRFQGFETTGQYWRRSGIAGFAADAALHFYLPERYTDPFGNETALQFDPYDLYLQSSTDALGNVVEIEQFDFRVLAPRRLRDINGNLSEVAFDILGMPTAAAVMGKGAEGDELTGLNDGLLNPDPETLGRLFTQDYDEARFRQLLGNATGRHLVYFGEVRNADGTITWGRHPACSCGIVREQHVHQLAEGAVSALQTAFEYSDGIGSVIVKKIQAEPEREGGPLRWIASGKTILNNKGKPVKQYEPYFSSAGHRFEEPEEAGVTPVMYYDAAGRLVRTEAPDGSHSNVVFSPWYMATYDGNDTVLEPGNAWYARHTAAGATAEERRAARMAAKYADTPAFTLLDSLGRTVVAVAHNRTADESPDIEEPDLLERDWLNARYVTFTKLDAEGKPLWIRDARGNLVMQYVRRLPPPAPQSINQVEPAEYTPAYDIAGNLLYQHSMDAGDRWMINDAAGKPLLSWDYNERMDETGTPVPEHRIFFTRYDRLHRPKEHLLTINENTPQLIERFVYGEPPVDDNEAGERARQLNLRGQLREHYDSSGRMVHVRYDFKGHLLEKQRTLASAYQEPVIDWSPGSSTAALEPETHAHITEYDALNRMTRQFNWHQVMPDSRVAVYEPHYNARGLLHAEDLIIRAVKTTTGYTEGAETQRVHAIAAIQYNAKGQKERMRLGNGTTTRYTYDPQTFRLLELLTTRPGYDPPPNYRSNLRDNRVLQQLLYTYDAVGNITEIYDEAYKPVYFSNAVIHPQSKYTYDALYHLIEATGRENSLAAGPPNQIQNDVDHIGFPNTDPNALRLYTQRYRYDRAGNIERMRHMAGPAGSWTRNYAYAEDSNRLLRTWIGNDVANAVVYNYDTHGSMLNLNRIPDEYRLWWDYNDMIHVANLGGGGFAYYNYESGKERTRKVIASERGVKQWERLYLGGMEIYRGYMDDVIVDEIETHHLFAGGQRVLIVEDILPPDRSHFSLGSRFRYQYSNHLGSACAELDESATVITCEEYKPYGTTTYLAGKNAAEVSLKRFRYIGKERDKESGFYYYGARYYIPWIGRWISLDPAEQIKEPNGYLYCGNNSIKFIDPDGYDPVPTNVPGLPTTRPIGGGGEIDLPGTRWANQGYRAPPRLAPPTQPGAASRAVGALRAAGAFLGTMATGAALTAVAVFGSIILYTDPRANDPDYEPQMPRREVRASRNPQEPLSAPPPSPPSVAVDPRQQQPAGAPSARIEGSVQDPTSHPPVRDPRERVRMEAHGRGRGRRVPPNPNRADPISTTPPDFVPYGFRGIEQFRQYGQLVYEQFGYISVRDIRAALQGSAVTGRSFLGRQAFDFRRMSDFDLALSSATLFERAGNAGIPIRARGTREQRTDEFEYPRTIEYFRVLGLEVLQQRISRAAGRNVNFMIYPTPNEVAARSGATNAPLIWLPRF